MTHEKRAKELLEDLGLPPTDFNMGVVEVHLREARDEALEEAAKRVDMSDERHRPMVNVELHNAAISIRAMKSKPDAEQGEGAK